MHRNKAETYKVSEKSTLCSSKNGSASKCEEKFNSSDSFDF